MYNCQTISLMDDISYKSSIFLHFLSKTKFYSTTMCSVLCIGISPVDTYRFSCIRHESLKHILFNIYFLPNRFDQEFK